MLKWLVTKPPNGSQTVVTDDPLATISKGRHKNEVIYAVSRINPLYQEDDEDTKTKEEPTQTVSTPGSPTDRESVRSSGYGSKEGDSVSYKSDSHEEDDSEKTMKSDPTYGQLNFKSPGTVNELRQSFEGLVSDTSDNCKQNFFRRNSKYVRSIKVGKSTRSLKEIPERGVCNLEAQKWPSVSHLAQELQKETDRITKQHAHGVTGRANHHNKAQILRFNPLVSVVAQDRKYVTGITLSPNFKTHQSDTSIDIHDNQIPAYFNSGRQYANEFPLLSLQPDSLVTEDTLKMMNYNEHNKQPPSSFEKPHYSSYNMPDFGKALYSSFHSTSTSRDSLSSSHQFRSHSSSMSSNSGKKKGPSVVQDLWEKTGLKTSGRKFLVDVNEIIHDRQSISSTKEQMQRSSSNNSVNRRSLEDPVYYSSIPNVYEKINYQMGLHNPAFVDDNDKPQSKTFQHNLTNFQKRISGSSWPNGIDDVDGQLDMNSNSIKKDKKPYKHPGKAVREFGLAENDWKKNSEIRPWNLTSKSQNDNFQFKRNGEQSRYWNNYGGWKGVNSRDSSLSSYISPHPNGGVTLYQPSGTIHDFTIDAHKLQRLNLGRVKSKCRRRCITVFIVLFGLCSFIGAIVGISLYLTNGERMFGPM